MAKIAKEIPYFDIDRFYEKIGNQDAVSKCIPWIGKINKKGYGEFYIYPHRNLYRAHRVMWFVHNGQPDIKLVIDHICRNKKCVNIEHLRLVKNRINVLENSQSLAYRNSLKTHCPRGHEYITINIEVRPNGSRACKACIGERRKLRYRINKLTSVKQRIIIKSS